MHTELRVRETVPDSVFQEALAAWPTTFTPGVLQCLFVPSVNFLICPRLSDRLSSGIFTSLETCA